MSDEVSIDCFAHCFCLLSTCRWSNQEKEGNQFTFSVVRLVKLVQETQKELATHDCNASMDMKSPLFFHVFCHSSFVDQDPLQNRTQSFQNNHILTSLSVEWRLRRVRATSSLFWFLSILSPSASSRLFG